MPRIFCQKTGLLLLAAVLFWLLAGCAWQGESDWRWRQWNPDYKAPWPAER